ncbi:MAG TPA: DUF192 domain-containing protein [Verrucomicrobiae bacterium]
MKLARFFAAVLLAPLLAGCNKTETTQTPMAPEAPTVQMPTEAQPKLPTIKIYLGAEVMDAELAVTPQEETTGMMFRTNIPEDDSMLFVLPYPTAASFWMTNCPVSESAAYISADGTIEELHHFEKNDPVPVVATNQNIQFVLETADGWFARHNVNVGMVIKTEKGSMADTFLRR